MARTSSQSWLLLLLLIYPVMTANDITTPDETIDALAKQKKDAVETFNGIFGGTADLMGKLLAGQKPSLFDVAKDIVPGLIGLTGDPLLAAVSAYVLSFLGGLFGGESAALSQAEEIESLINIDLLRNTLQSDIAWLHGATENVMRAANEFNGTRYSKQLQGALFNAVSRMTEKEGDIFSDCSSPTAFPGIDAGSQKCLGWSQTGSISMAIDYVSLRLQTEASLANAHAGDVEFVKYQATVIKTKGAKYQPIIQGMYNIFRTSRLMAIEKPVNSNEACQNFGEGEKPSKTEGVKDNFNGFDFMNGCTGFYPRPDGFYNCANDACTCYFAALYCYNTYVKKIQTELKRMEDKFVSLQKLIDIPTQDDGTTSEVIAKPKQSTLQKLRGFDTHVSSARAENRTESSSSGIDYCSQPDQYDWCDRSTGSTGLWVWPSSDPSKKQAYTMACSSSQSIFVSIPGSCASWQCFGQSDVKETCFDQHNYGSGEVLLAWSCSQKLLSDTGRLCWKYLPPVPSSSENTATKSLVV